ncbi:MAG: hypothetical protein HOH18_00165, partial [Kordiimonadaceae bacterium]|nr:hypothetical protein [Kordiimonadaceae bacterium]
MIRLIYSVNLCRIVRACEKLSSIEMLNTNPIQYPAPQADISCFPQAYSADESAEIFALLKTDLDWQQAHITLYGRTVPIPRLQQWYGDAAYTYSRLHM